MNHRAAPARSTRSGDGLLTHQHRLSILAAYPDESQERPGLREGAFVEAQPDFTVTLAPAVHFVLSEKMVVR
jgi:hypothetical protein